MPCATWRFKTCVLWAQLLGAAGLFPATRPVGGDTSDEGVLRRHAPDLLLTDRRGAMTVVDVKPAEFAERPKVHAVFSWTARLCRAKGVRYEVWSGADPVMLANIRTLAAARRGVGPAELAAASAAGRTGMTMGQVEDLMAASGMPGGRLAMLNLLWRGDWAVDMTRPLDSTAVLSVEAGRA